MTEGFGRGDVDVAAVERAVDRYYPILEGFSEEELRAAVGEMARGPELLDPDTVVRANDLEAEGFNLFRGRTVRDIICDTKNREDIEDALKPDTVKALLVGLLAVLGTSFVVGVGLVALVVLILRIGLNEYCREDEIPDLPASDQSQSQSQASQA